MRSSSNHTSRKRPLSLAGSVFTRTWLLSFFVIAVLTTLSVFSASTWTGVLANGSTGGTGGTGPELPESPFVELVDGLGVPVEVLSLSSIGDSVQLTLVARGLAGEQFDTVQLLIEHNSDVTQIRNASCIGEFEDAYSPDDAVQVATGEGTAYLCFDPAGVTGDDSHVMELELVRVGHGSDELKILTSGVFATAYFKLGDSVVPDTADSIQVVNLPAPTPTAVPTSTPGGGGNPPPPPPPPAPQPQPTATPSAPLPGVPQEVEVEAGDRIATISWEPPENAEAALVNGYTAGILGTSQLQALPVTARSATFNGLTNGETIQLQVRASGTAGLGPYSQSVSATPAGLPQAPREVQATLQADMSSILVEWLNPLDDGGAAIAEYHVFSVTSNTDPVVVAADTRSVLFEDLDTGTYSFSVTAVNSTGPGDQSDATDPIQIGAAPPIVEAPEEAPSEPMTDSGSSSSGAISARVTLDEPARQGILNQFGNDAALTGETIELRWFEDRLHLAIPLSLAGRSVPNEITFSNVDFSLALNGGMGTFEFTASSSARIVGTGHLIIEDGQLFLRTSEVQLLFDPYVDLDESTAASGIRFEVELINVPSGGSLDVSAIPSLSYIDEDDFSALQNLFASANMQVTGNAEDTALVVDVTKAMVGNQLFGTNRVFIEVDPEWVTNALDSGADISIVKVNDEGLTYYRPAQCSETDDATFECSAEFTGEAGGFSTFGLLVARRMPPPTELPVVNSTPVATAGPASAQPTAPAPTATAAPQPGGSSESSPKPTATPTVVPPTETAVPLPVPTPVAISDDGPGDNGVLVPVLIVLAIGSAVVVGLVGLRRRRSGPVVGVLLVVAAGTTTLIQPGHSHAHYSAANSSAPQVSAVQGNPSFGVSKLFELNATMRSEGNPGDLVAVNTVESDNPLVQTGVEVVDGQVLVSALTQDPESLAAELTAAGMSNPTISENTVNGRLPLSAYLTPGRFQTDAVFQVEQPFTSSGSVISEGLEAHRIFETRNFYGLTGSGVNVGVISDSWDCLGNYATDVAQGELPAGVIVLEEISSCSGAIDEGRAMAQIIHDVAPGAQLMFHTGFNGSVNMAEGIRELAAAGADIIVDDVGYLNMPFFQDGIIGEAVNDVVADGVSYFSSAGNYADQSYEKDFNGLSFEPVDSIPSAPGAPRFFGGVPHGFGDTGTRTSKRFFLEQNEWLTVYLQWDDTFLSANGVGASSDLDLYLFDDSGNIVLAGSATQSAGFDPFEAISIINTGPQTFIGELGVYLFSGPVPGKVKFIFRTNSEDNAGLFSSEPGERAGTIFGHANSAGAIAVGAIEHPGVGTPDQRGTNVLTKVEPFSSHGGVPILRNSSGTPIAPIVRSRPDFLAADGVSTTTGLNPFFGTSAAAPHAAAVAALIVEADPSATPGEIRTAFGDTAIDMFNGDALRGFDYITGSGMMNVPGAISQLGMLHSGREYDYDATGLDTTSTDLIFLGVEATNGIAGNRVIALAPTTGEEVWSFNLGFTPDQVAVADDGSKVYVSELGTERIVRVDVATGVIDLDFSSPVFDASLPDGFQNLDVQPGNPDVLAVAFGIFKFPEAHAIEDSLAVFNNGVRIRPANSESDQAFEVAFNNDGSILYATGPLDTLKYEVTDSSVTLIEVFDGSHANTQIATGGGAVITSHSFVFGETALDPPLDALDLHSGGNNDDRALVMLSGDGDRALFIGRMRHTEPVQLDRYRTGSLEAFDLPSRPGYQKTGVAGYIGSMPLPFADGFTQDLRSWGTHGFAFLREDGEVFIGRTELIEDTLLISGEVALAGLTQGVSISGQVIDAVSVDGSPGMTAPVNDGLFQLSVLNGRYDLRASLPGFLSAVAEGILVLDGNLVTDRIELVPGDSDGDEDIDNTDAELVSGSFGDRTMAGERSDGAGNTVDMDGDGVVTGRDLSLLAIAFGQTGPVQWSFGSEETPPPAPTQSPTPGPTSTPTPVPTPTPTVELGSPVVLAPVVDGSLRDGLGLLKDGSPDRVLETTTVQVLDGPQFEERGVIEFGISGAAGLVGAATLDLSVFSSMSPFPFDVDVFGYTTSADGVLGLDDWDSGSFVGTFAYNGAATVSVDVTSFIQAVSGTDYVGFRFEFAEPSQIELNGPFVAFGSTEKPPAATLTLRYEA